MIKPRKSVYAQSAAATGLDGFGGRVLELHGEVLWVT